MRPPSDGSLDPQNASVIIAEGAFLGALIGDAAGSALEFKEKVTDQLLQGALGMRGGGPFKTAPGQVTDDGELAMALAWGLVEGQGKFEAESIASYYAHWVDSKPFDIGATTRKAMWVTPAKGQSMAEAMRASAKLHCGGSQSNGSLMRCTPLAIWGHKLPQADFVVVCRAEVSLTHPSPVIQDSTVAYCLAIIHLINHPHDRTGAWETVTTWASKHADRVVQEWLDLVEATTEVPFAPQIGWARIAFVHAFRHLRRNSSYLDAMTTVLKGGGDTDTNACIAGGLIGAAVGVNAIPIGMRSVVLQCNIQAGSQPSRPEWLQTAFSYPRVLPALVHMAPTMLQKDSSTPPRAIVPFSNKITTAGTTAATLPATATALAAKTSLAMSTRTDTARLSAAMEPEVRPSDKHVIGGQRSSGFGPQPAKPTLDPFV